MTAEAPSWQPEVQAQIKGFGTNSPLLLFDIERPSLFTQSGLSLKGEVPNRGNLPVRVARRRNDGGREGTEADYSSYTEVERDLPDALGLISYFRERIYPYKNRTTPDGILSVIAAVQWLPYFIVNRSDGQPFENGMVPSVAISAAKAVRGAGGPFDIYKAGDIGMVSGKKLPLPTSLELTQAGPYVEYIMRNGLLVSQRDPGKSCPAKEEPDIIRVAQALLEGPTGDQVKTGKMLESWGITKDTFSRIKKFGHACESGIKATIEFAHEIETQPGFARLLHQGRPIMIRYEGQLRPRDMVADYLTKINSSQEVANKALRRQPPRPLTRGNVADVLQRYRFIR